jgi:hypothetical protein
MCRYLVNALSDGILLLYLQDSVVNHIVVSRLYSNQPTVKPYILQSLNAFVRNVMERWGPQFRAL